MWRNEPKDVNKVVTVKLFGIVSYVRNPGKKMMLCQICDVRVRVLSAGDPGARFVCDLCKQLSFDSNQKHFHSNKFVLDCKAIVVVAEFLSKS